MDKKKTLVLYSTLECNRKCSHCFADGNIKKPKNTNVSFSYDVLQELALKYTRHYNLILNGAELLLHPEYLPICKIINQDYVYSNGMIFENDRDSSLITSLRENGITTIILSHHFQSTEILNGVPNSTVERITKKLQDKCFIVKYNSTLTEHNYRHIEANCEYAYSLGVKGIKFFEIRKSGKASQIDNTLFLSKCGLSECYSSILKVRQKFSQQEFDVRINADLDGISPRFVCEYGVNLLTVTPDMQIYGCPFAISNHEPIGVVAADYNLLITDLAKHDGQRCIVTLASELRG